MIRITKALRNIRNINEFLFVLFNQFFPLKIFGIKIPKKNLKLVLAYLRLKKHKAQFTISSEEIIFKIGKYTLTSSVYDESILMSFEENIINDEYQLDSIDVNNKTIIDIGANIGDTALHFIQRGAKRVYSLEPIPQTYSYLQQNISNNSLEDRIIPFNLGIGNKNEKFTIPVRENASGGNSLTFIERNKQNKQYSKDVEVSVITLEELSQQISYKVDIVKIDCEGCEYSIIQNDYLMDFFNPEIIIIEYHMGEQNIRDWLKNRNYEIFKSISKNNNLGLIFSKILV
jgi:FkbM family methyltransferase